MTEYPAPAQERVDAVYAGGIGILGPEGHRSGIFKNRIYGPVTVGTEGISGDEQADRRVHGGPEKAIHHYAADNYALLAEAFPGSATMLVPGSLGENISTWHLTEQNVYIGDIFRIGSAVLQVSQPRSPCWKINHRFEEDQLSIFVARQHRTGWYYRVLESGIFQEGNSIELLERCTDRVNIDHFWQVQLNHRPAIEDLQEIIAINALASDWKRRLRDRMNWLQTHGLLG